jgi:hypothetical protein
MIPDPKELLDIARIKIPLIGLYDVPGMEAFDPIIKPTRCFFSAYEHWLKGEYVCISKEDPEYSATCQGGAYWIGSCLPEWVPNKSGSRKEGLDKFATGLNQREGFKLTDELMYQWLDHLKPFTPENTYVVIGPLRDDQYKYLKTITFYVNPDQLSFLIHGAEYKNASINNHPVKTAFGSGCGQIAALLGELNTDVPKALIGATDMAMREHLPADILAFTVNKPMYVQLCALDENSFMHKNFWRRLMEKRNR